MKYYDIEYPNKNLYTVIVLALESGDSQGSLNLYNFGTLWLRLSGSSTSIRICKAGENGWLHSLAHFLLAWAPAKRPWWVPRPFPLFRRPSRKEVCNRVQPAIFSSLADPDFCWEAVVVASQNLKDLMSPGDSPTPNAPMQSYAWIEPTTWPDFDVGFSWDFAQHRLSATLYLGEKTILPSDYKYFADCVSRILALEPRSPGLFTLESISKDLPQKTCRSVNSDRLKVSETTKTTHQNAHLSISHRKKKHTHLKPTAVGHDFFTMSWHSSADGPSTVLQLGGFSKTLIARVSTLQYQFTQKS